MSLLTLRTALCTVLALVAFCGLCHQLFSSDSLALVDEHNAGMSDDGVIALMSKAEQARLIKDLKQATASIARGRARRAAAKKAQLAKEGRAATHASEKQADDQEMVSAEQLAKALAPVAREMQMTLGDDSNKPTQAKVSNNSPLTQKHKARIDAVRKDKARISAPAAPVVQKKPEEHKAAEQEKRRHIQREKSKKNLAAKKSGSDGGSNKYSASAMMEAMRLEHALSHPRQHRLSRSQLKARNAAEAARKREESENEAVDPRKLAEELSKAVKWSGKGKVAKIDDDEDDTRSKRFKMASGTEDLHEGGGDNTDESLAKDLAAAADTIKNLRPPPVDTHKRALHLAALRDKVIHHDIKKKPSQPSRSNQQTIGMKDLHLPTSISDIMEPPVLQRMRAANHGHLKLPSISSLAKMSKSHQKMAQVSNNYDAGVPQFSWKKMEGELTAAKERALGEARVYKAAAVPPSVHAGGEKAVGSEQEKQLAAEISKSVLSHLKSIVTHEVDKDLLHDHK